MGPKTSTTGVVAAAGILMFANILSRILGFIREMVTTQIFGRTWVTDAFYSAFAIPDLMYRLLIGGALSAAFIPVFTSYLARNQEEEAWDVASTFINLVVLLLFLMMFFGVLFADKLAPLVAYAFEGEQRVLLVELMRVMFPAVFFTALAGLSRGILESYRYFTGPAFGPIVYNIAIITGAYFLGPVFGIKGMATGVVVGAIGNMLLQLILVLRKIGAGGYKLSVNLKHPGMKRLLLLMVPSVVGLSVTQINLIINQNLASGLNPGDITALRLANRLMELPVGIFVTSISTALFPTMARQVANNEMDEFKEMLTRGLSAIFFVMVPAAVGLATLRVPIVRLLFQRGEFSHLDTQATAYALLFYSVGILGLGGVQLLVRAFYSLHDTMTPLKIGVFTVALNVALNLIFLRFTTLSHGGLALAYSIATTFNALVLLLVLNRKVKGLHSSRLTISLAKFLICALLMAAVVNGVANFTEGIYGIETIKGRGLQVGLSIMAGILVYGFAALILGTEELFAVVRLLSERVRKKR